MDCHGAFTDSTLRLRYLQCQYIGICNFHCIEIGLGRVVPYCRSIGQGYRMPFNGLASLWIGTIWSAWACRGLLNLDSEIPLAPLCA